MDGTGPLGKGSGDGRKLGRCLHENDIPDQFQLGKGMGLRRNADKSNRTGKGRRLQSGNYK